MNAEDTRITSLDPLASSSLARQSEAKRKQRLKARQMCVDDENVISKNCPSLIAQETQ